MTRDDILLLLGGTCLGLLFGLSIITGWWH